MRVTTTATLVALMATGALMPPAAKAAEVGRTPLLVAGVTSATLCESVLNCIFVFPQVGTNRRFDIKFATCLFQGTAPSEFGVLLAAVAVNDASQLPRINLSVNARVVGILNINEVSQPIALTIPAGKRPQILLQYQGTATRVECALSGDLVFLQ